MVLKFDKTLTLTILSSLLFLSECDQLVDLTGKMLEMQGKFVQTSNKYSELNRPIEDLYSERVDNQQLPNQFQVDKFLGLFQVTDQSSITNDNSTVMKYIEKQLYNFYDVQLYSQLYIGSQKQPFNDIFDTGSAVIFINSY